MMMFLCLSSALTLAVNPPMPAASDVEPRPRLLESMLACQAANRPLSDMPSPSGFSPAAPSLATGLPEPYEQMITAITLRQIDPMRPVFPCFTPGTPDDVVTAFEEAMTGGLRFQLTGRWGTTAVSGGGLGQGDPTVLTYSFVPDGTTIPAAVGNGGPSSLFNFLNRVYGSPANWQPLFAQIFQRWSDLSGLTYVFEPNDDGVPLSSAPGLAGVRGDLRIGAVLIDGNNGVLAYNNFPEDGDMVLDANDTFYNTTTGNSIRLRNVLAHEHGHGMGLLHVCPATATKLMEPFISTAYDGPQLDDILAVQRHYGDPFENNDSVALATDLGTFDTTTTVVVNDLSCDSNTDVDVFKVFCRVPRQFTARIEPLGATYNQGPQTGNCTGGAAFNSLTQNDLSLQGLDVNGATVLAGANQVGAGGAEQITFVAPTRGDYFIRVQPGPANAIQRYQLTVSSQNAPFIPPFITFPEPLPALVPPGVNNSFLATVNPGQDSIVNGPVLMYRSTPAGAFAARPMTLVSGNQWRAILPPAQCGTTPEFFVSVTGAVGGVINQPTPPAALTIGAFSAVFSDNFQTNLGWIVSGTVTDGPWTRGVPSNGNRGDPPTDFDGSGQCFVTDNVAGNSDVDDGSTILTSPAFNMLNGEISFAWWLNDVAGGVLTPEDGLFVEIATNSAGTNWARLRTFNTAASSWRTDRITVGPGMEIAGSATLRIRFIAADLGVQNVVEAGVDAVIATAFACTNPPITCPCDWNQADGLDSQDYFDFLDGFFAGNADFNGTGGTDSQDYFEFLDCFFTLPEGC